jgi:DNA-binding response OmpR family regulator
VYNQLIEFKARLLSRAQRDMKSLPPEARKAVEADFILIEAQRSRYQRQRDFWYTRQWELEGVSIDSETRSVDHRGKSASFTNREFQLLQLFLAHPGRFFKAPELLLQAWHDPGLSEEELRTYMGQLDKKLAGLRLGRVAHRGRQGYSIEFTSLE